MDPGNNEDDGDEGFADDDSPIDEAMPLDINQAGAEEGEYVLLQYIVLVLLWYSYQFDMRATVILSAPRQELLPEGNCSCWGTDHKMTVAGITYLITFYAPAMKSPGHIVLPLSVIPSFRIQFPLIFSVIHGDFLMKFGT